MEHPCHKCGANVEEGVPFCKHCGAPQIRVPAADAEPLPPPKPSESSPQVAPPSPEIFQIPQTTLRAREQSSQIVWAHALPRAAGAGVLCFLAIGPMAVLGPLAVGPVLMLGGAIAVMLYRRRLGNTLPTAGAGARIGAASGGFAFLFLGTITVATLVYRPNEIRQALLDSLSQMATRGYDPQKAQQLRDLLNTSQGLMSLTIAGLLLVLLIFVAGAGIGGALYAAWVRRRRAL
jgi:hypothetical protein